MIPIRPPSLGSEPCQPERKPFFKKFGWTQQINYFGGDASDNYRSLQAAVEKRFAKGFPVSLEKRFSSAACREL